MSFRGDCMGERQMSFSFYSESELQRLSFVSDGMSWVKRFKTESVITRILEWDGSSIQ